MWPGLRNLNFLAWFMCKTEFLLSLICKMFVVDWTAFGFVSIKTIRICVIDWLVYFLYVFFLLLFYIESFQQNAQQIASIISCYYETNWNNYWLKFIKLLYYFSFSSSKEYIIIYLLNSIIVEKMCFYCCVVVFVFFNWKRNIYHIIFIRYVCLLLAFIWQNDKKNICFYCIFDQKIKNIKSNNSNKIWKTTATTSSTIN